MYMYTHIYSLPPDFLSARRGRPPTPVPRMCRFSTRRLGTIKSGPTAPRVGRLRGLGFRVLVRVQVPFRKLGHGQHTLWAQPDISECSLNGGPHLWLGALISPDPKGLYPKPKIQSTDVRGADEPLNDADVHVISVLCGLPSTPPPPRTLNSKEEGASIGWMFQ